MNLRPKYVIACDHGIIDVAGKFSAIGIFNEVNLSENGTQVLSFTVIGRFFVEESDQSPRNATAEIVNSANQVVGAPVILEDVTAIAKQDLKILINFDAIEFSKPGTHQIRLSYGGVEVFKGYLFEVVSRGGPTQP